MQIDDNSTIQSILCHLSNPREMVENGDKLLNWIKNVCVLYIPPKYRIACGARIVPQTGVDAGRDDFEFYDINSDYADLPNQISTIAKEICVAKWNVLKNEKKSEFDEILKASGNFLVVQPICGAFKRSVGFIWSITPTDKIDKIQNHIEISSFFTSLFIHQILTQHAISLLGKSLSSEIASFDDGADFIANAIKVALSCKAVIVWRLVSDNDTGKVKLQSVATSGEASELSFSMELGEGVAGKCAQDASEILVDDLHDKNCLQRLGITRLAQEKIVLEKKWRSGFFSPLLVGDNVYGVVSCYVGRAASFTVTEQEVFRAFVQKFCVMIDGLEKNNERLMIKKRLIAASPVIETGLLALENMHDVLGTLFMVQDKIENIKRKYRKGVSAHDIADNALVLINKAGQVLNSTVRQSKIDQLSISKVEISDYIQSIAHDLKENASAYKIEIILDVDKNTVYIDPVKIRRVFMNLFDNSFYFLKSHNSPKNKQIKISSAVVGDRLRVTFEDNGRGIPQYALPHIFEFLFSTKGEHGSGLGLAICQTIIAAHEGKIWANSEFSKFTRIHFELPTIQFNPKANRISL